MALHYLVIFHYYYVSDCRCMVLGRPFVKRFALSYRTVVCLSCPMQSVCDVGVLWPNGLMD